VVIPKCVTAAETDGRSATGMYGTLLLEIYADCRICCVLEARAVELFCDLGVGTGSVNYFCLDWTEASPSRSVGTLGGTVLGNFVT
jgi:hypothetical protein